MGNFQSKLGPYRGYADQEYNYVNKGFVLEFFHIPTGKIIQFKALLTQFEDKYESSWNHEEVYGRMDPISTFKGTKRVISLGWDVVAASTGEAIENLQRVTLLLSMLYPTYASTRESNASTISAAPLFKLSFVNLIKDYGVTPPVEKSPAQQQSAQRSYADPEYDALNKALFGVTETQTKLPPPKRQTVGKRCIGQAKSAGLVGTIGGFVYGPDLDQGMFDPSTGPGAGKLYPQAINLSCEFTVLHTHPLGWSVGREFRNPNFPYGESIKEVNPKPTRVMENRGGGTDRQKTSRRNSIIKLRIG